MKLVSVNKIQFLRILHCEHISVNFFSRAKFLKMKVESAMNKKL